MGLAEEDFCQALRQTFWPMRWRNGLLRLKTRPQSEDWRSVLSPTSRGASMKRYEDGLAAFETMTGLC